MRELGLFFIGLTSTVACCGPRPVARLQDRLSAEDHLALGVEYQSRGFKSLSVEEYRAALRRDRNNTAALMALGNIAFEEKRFREAERHYRHVLKNDPAHSGASNNLAMVYTVQRIKLRVAEALAKRAAIPGDEKYPYAMDTLANIYLLQKRYRDAQRALDEARRFTPLGNDQLSRQIELSEDAVEQRITQNEQLEY